MCGVCGVCGVWCYLFFGKSLTGGLIAGVEEEVEEIVRDTLGVGTLVFGQLLGVAFLLALPDERERDLIEHVLRLHDLLAEGRGPQLLRELPQAREQQRYHNTQRSALRVSRLPMATGLKVASDDLLRTQGTVVAWGVAEEPPGGLYETKASRSVSANSQ